jgi:hypothetical protein
VAAAVAAATARGTELGGRAEESDRSE